MRLDSRYRYTSSPQESSTTYIRVCYFRVGHLSRLHLVKRKFNVELIKKKQIKNYILTLEL